MNKLPPLIEWANGVENIAYQLLAFRQYLLQLYQQKKTKGQSCSQIIEESVREISVDELNDLFVDKSVESNQLRKQQECLKQQLLTIMDPVIIGSHIAQLQKPELVPISVENVDRNESSLKDTTLPVIKQLLDDSYNKLDVIFTPYEQHDFNNICKQCGKIFANKHLLKKHTFIHTGIRPFICDLCGKSFNRKDNLQRHRMLPHPAASSNTLILKPAIYSHQ